jgi:hypothetical protein
LNRIIAQMVSGCTTSLRFESELNASLAEIVGNLVPDDPFRYPIISLSPIRNPGIMKHENFTTKEIVTDLFDRNFILCDVGEPHVMRSNRLLASCILLRGTQNVVELPDGEPVGSTVGGPKTQAMQVKDALDAVGDLMNPRGGHRQPLKFLPWLASGGFKVGVVGNAPKIPKSWNYAESQRQGAALSNHTAVRTLFMEQYKKFIRLFYNKAYVWQFLEASGELDSFYEAKESFRQLLDAYQNLLGDSHKEELITDPQAKVIGQATIKD